MRQNNRYLLRWLRPNLNCKSGKTAIIKACAQIDAKDANAKMFRDADKVAASHTIQSDNQELCEAQFAHKVLINKG